MADRKQITTIFFVVVSIFLKTASTATLTEDPVSVSVLVGENALFHCAGSDGVVTLEWIVDGYLVTDTIIVERRITYDTVSSGTIFKSTLTVPATLVNNGTTVHCIVLSLSGSVNSSDATLTILPGIDPVVNANFSSFFGGVRWYPPVTAGVLNDLMYRVIVVNDNTDQVIVNGTTNGTYYDLPRNGTSTIQPCQYYTANVTAFSSQHHSDSVVFSQMSPGEYFGLNIPSLRVVSYNDTHTAVTFNVTIFERKQLCPDQELMSVTYPVSDSSDRTPQLVVNITQPGVIQYTVFVEKSCHCAADFMIINNEKNMRSVNFSSYNVQDCDVSSDQHTSSILVECTFAINSTAPGIVVIQDDQSQYTINGTLQRLLQDSDKGSVNITGLPAGEYSVRVYDNSSATDSTSAAYQHSQLIHIMGPTSNSTVPITVIIIGIPVLCVSCVIGLCVIMIVVSIKLRIHRHIRQMFVDLPKCCTKEDDRSIHMRDISQHAESSAHGDLEKGVSDLTPPTSAHEENEQPVNTGPVYADLQHSANPPAPPIPVEPVLYATVTGNNIVRLLNKLTLEQQEPVYTELCHSINPPPSFAEPVPIQHDIVIATGKTSINSTNKDEHPHSFSSGYHSAPSADLPTVSTESTCTGPFQKIFIQPSACKPDYPQLNELGPLSVHQSSLEGGDSSSDHYQLQSEECNDTTVSQDQHVIYSPVSDITPSLTERDECTVRIHSGMEQNAFLKQDQLISVAKPVEIKNEVMVSTGIRPDSCYELDHLVYDCRSVTRNGKID